MPSTGSYSRELGQRGFDRISDTKIHHADATANQEGNGGTDDGSNTYYSGVHKWVAIKVVGTVAFGAGMETKVGSKIETGDSFPDGDIIQGPFTKIQLSSGTVYAYRS